MKVNFNKKLITDIIVAVRQYKVLYVTTQGVMFRSNADADNSVRTTNSILDDPADYVGIATLTADMFTAESIIAIGRDVENFNKLFENAVVPRSKRRVAGRGTTATSTFNAGDIEEIESLLNGGAPASEEKPTGEEKPASEEKPTPATTTTTTTKK